jgi:cytochrome c oxidase subunit 2
MTNFFPLGELLEFSFSKLVMAGSQSWWDAMMPPKDISTNGHLIDSLFNYTTYLNIFYFLLVFGGLIGFSFLYNRKRHPKPYYTYGNTKKQILLTAGIGAAVFLSIDMKITTMSSNDLINVFWNYPKGDDVVKIEVLAQQWMWNFRYPGPDSNFNTDDDYVSNHDLYVPVGKKIEFRVSSKDVIHSFYLPNARLKVDAIPGRITRFWVEFTEPGNFEVACAEMCGTHHYMMKGRLIVLSQEKYAQFLKDSTTIATYANDTSNLDNYWGWKWENE